MPPKNFLATTRKHRTAGFNFKLWIKSRYELVTTSMFFSPALAIVAAIGMGFLLAWIDSYVVVDHYGMEQAMSWTTTLDSARALLSTVASATISFAGTAFSVALLVIQLGSSQYSPRVVPTLYSDSFNRRIVAFVVGTFTYCLVVIRSMDRGRDHEEEEEDDVVVLVPNLSVAVAVILGILSVLFIVAFIDHSAKTMDVSQLLERVTRDTIYHIQQTWEEEEGGGLDDKSSSEAERQGEEIGDNTDDGGDNHSYNEENEDNPKSPKSKIGEEADAEALEDSHVVRFQSSGWVQELDLQGLKALVPAHGYMKLHTVPGRYAIPGAAICIVYPKPGLKMSKDDDDSPSSAELGNSQTENSNDQEEQQRRLDRLDNAVLDCVLIGQSRTIRCDPAYGLRQLVDVVLRALSPGVNDPTTAQDGIFHAAAVVTEFLHRSPPPAKIKTKAGGTLILNESHDYDSIVRLGFDEARICAASSPTVALYLLEALRLIRESLCATGRPGRAPEIERQARLIEANILKANHVEDDHNFITKARRDRFEPENFWNRGLWVA